MSIQAVAWALDQEVPDAAAKLVLISLANAMNGKTGRCFPTVEQICKESSCSKSTVLRKLKWLEGEGWISINSEFADDGRQLANSYTLGCQHDTGRVSERHGEGFNSDTLGGVNCDTPTKDKPEEIPEAAATRAVRVDRLEEKLLEAVGDKIQPHGALVLSSIYGLLEAGCDLETDILPTIRARASKLTRPAGSWAYFVPAIRDAYEQRIAAGKGLLKPKDPVTLGQWEQGLPPDEQRAKWAKTLAMARSTGQWKTWLWGPKPGDPGCRVPEDLIAAERYLRPEKLTEEMKVPA